MQPPMRWPSQRNSCASCTSTELPATLPWWAPSQGIPRGQGGLRGCSAVHLEKMARGVSVDLVHSRLCHWRRRWHTENISSLSHGVLWDHRRDVKKGPGLRCWECSCGSRCWGVSTIWRLERASAFQYWLFLWLTVWVLLWRFLPPRVRYWKRVKRL